MYPHINDCFRPQGSELFVAKAYSANDPSPPYIVAHVAMNRVEGGDLDFPEGYDNNWLDTLRILFGSIGTERILNFRQGVELRDLGRQILNLDEQGRVQPPLDDYETQAIQRLVSVVTASEVVIAHRS